MAENAVTKQDSPKAPETISQVLQVLVPQLARAVPKGMDPDRIARIVQTEIRKSRNAKAAGIAKQSLDDCTQESFAGALLTSAALGLEPGVNGECYLVPYRDTRRGVVECQLIIGYQGIVKLFWQHPRASRIDAQWVGANDEFHYTMGLNPTLKHVKAKGDRGNPVYFYAIVEVTGAEPLWDVFTADEIRELRRGKVGSSGDIKDPQRWMERKTALKQVLKLAPKTTRLDAAIRADDRPGTDLSQSQALALPSTVKPTADYIDGEIAEPHEVDTPPKSSRAQRAQRATAPAPDVQMANPDQLKRLGEIQKAEKYNDADWFKFLADSAGVKATRAADLTFDEAKAVIDMFDGPNA
ncbi:recombinase RecT [Mycobacterium tuberculosis]|uniref:RecT-like DNA pairing protein n=12 Tax=root TaxID=1 RepID=Q854T9_9CAUD|nr:recombinase RecT [Mycobacterium tuberculosis]NP_817738.1 RecT-like ssDNA annealing protein [Mycobacterium phage Che9c]ADL66910.1 recombinase [Cloning vector pNit::ET]AGY30910.1 Che9c 61 [Gene deletion vector pYS1]ASK09412.1 gp61 [synthetic construct]AAN12619.1 RecT-like DNA pairing protein [Mycobacterium phage Che9c]